jgi:hypothetical protein
MITCHLMVNGIVHIVYFHLYRSCLNMDLKFLMLIHQGLIFIEVSNLDSIVQLQLEV